MKTIETKIVIHSSPKKIWNILVNTKEYPSWNPFITQIRGEFKKNNHIEVIINPPNSHSMKFKPKILIFKKNTKIEWLGKFLIKGLFDGKHSFEIIQNKDNSSTFIQKEVFTGILVPLFSKKIEINTKEGFVLMNKKLKDLCEK